MLHIWDILYGHNGLIGNDKGKCEYGKGVCTIDAFFRGQHVKNVWLVRDAVA